MIRPRRVVLLYCHDEARRSELACVLSIRGNYIVEDLDLESHAVVALVVHDQETSRWAAKHIAERFPETPLLVVLPRLSSQYTEGYPEQILPVPDNDNALILDYVHIAVARKKGPKRGAEVFDERSNTA